MKRSEIIPIPLLSPAAESTSQQGSKTIESARHFALNFRPILALIGALLSTVLLLPLTGASPARGAQVTVTETELETLAHSLRQHDTSAAYEKLAAYARRNPGNDLGARAALALGYRDLNRGRAREALKWFEQAERGTLLRDYAVFWAAQAQFALGDTRAGLAGMESYRKEFPDGVMAEQAVAALAAAAIQARQPQRALFALEAFTATPQRPALLLLRAKAREMDRSTAGAAKDYVAIYYNFPLSSESKPAGERLEPLARALREEFPRVTAEQRLARVQVFFDAHRWREARGEYEKLFKRLGGADRERAMLRAAQCRAQLKEGPKPLDRLAISGAAVDAERLFSLAQVYRGKKQAPLLLATVEKVAARLPHSRWAAESLSLAGNYFWSELDRDRAAQFYRRVLEATPDGPLALAADWRLAWLAYLDRRPDAQARLESHLRRFSGSSYTGDALYWLGRNAERAGDLARARAFYLKLAERYPQTYFGSLGRERLNSLGAAGAAGVEVLSFILPPSPLPTLEKSAAPAVAVSFERARALRQIAFDSSTELELRAGYLQTGEARLLLEAAQDAVQAGRYSAAIVMTRQAVPQLESRRWEEVPRDVWATAFPLPYSAAIRQHAQRAGVDPMLVAGLIRQESAFQAGAISRAKALGLMQVLPGTGKILARKLKVSYSRAKLFQPEYNLQLGTRYLADLLRMFGDSEAAIASYDAGEDRIAGWQAERKYEEIAEFVESIPFTETREYVQIVKRNAEIYRRLEAAHP